MTELAHILNRAALAAHLAEGNVRAQVHPTRPYVIYNYSEKCAYDGVWDRVTLTCRGLIVDTTTDEVLARPFRKFFNYAQAGAPTLDLNAAAIVTDKQDGSLGVLYPTPDGWAVATRGSFASEQAIHATELLRTRYDGYEPPPGLTVLVEIVYPANRIVVDYGDLDDLVLLGAVDIASGLSLWHLDALGWPGPVTTQFAHRSLAEALGAPPRPNAEGLVVHLLDADERVKLKQEDYVRLHRIVTGLNARVVWQHLIDGKPLDELVAPLPDEFHPWCRDVAEQLAATVEQGATDIDKAFAELVACLPEGWSRKDFAMLAVPHPLKWALFLTLDGRDVRSELWKHAKPEAYWTPSGRTFTEDNA